MAIWNSFLSAAGRVSTRARLAASTSLQRNGSRLWQWLKLDLGRGRDDLQRFGRGLRDISKRSGKFVWRWTKRGARWSWERTKTSYKSWKDRRKKSDDPDEEPDHAKTYPWFYFAYWAIFAGLVAWPMIEFPEYRWWILAPAIAAVIYRTDAIGSGYKGGVSALGVATISVWPFPVPLAPGMSLLRIIENPKQLQFPADPQYIYRGPDKQPPLHADGETQMVEPFTPISGPRDPKFVDNDLLNGQSSAEVTGTTRWKIRNFWDFWIRIAGDTAEEKLTEASRQLNDTWMEAVKVQFLKGPIGKIIDAKNQIKLRKETCAAVDLAARTRGIDAYEVTTKIRVPPELDAELTKVRQALAVAEQTRTNAEAAKFAAIKAAEGAAEEYRLKENAESDAIAYRADQFKTTPMNLLMVEEGPKFLGDKTQFIFGAEGLAQAFGAVFAAVSGSKPNDAANTTIDQKGA